MTDTTNAADALERLEEKWRADARGGNAGCNDEIVSLTLRNCANELAALRASLADRQGEAVGEVAIHVTPEDWGRHPEMRSHYVNWLGEAPPEGTKLYTHPAPEATDARKVLEDLLAHVDVETCTHEETHRGGVLWTICDGCGRDWADDCGGFQPHQDAPAVAAARAYIAALQNGAE